MTASSNIDCNGECLTMSAICPDGMMESDVVKLFRARVCLRQALECHTPSSTRSSTSRKKRHLKDLSAGWERSQHDPHRGHSRLLFATRASPAGNSSTQAAVTAYRYANITGRSYLSTIANRTLTAYHTVTPHDCPPSHRPICPQLCYLPTEYHSPHPRSVTSGCASLRRVASSPVVLPTERPLTRPNYSSRHLAMPGLCASSS